jgi:hypothetical protein
LAECQLLQARNALFDRRMGAEQAGNGAAMQRVDNIQMRRGRVDGQRALGAPESEFAQRRCKRAWIASNICPCLIGTILTRP